MPSACVLTKYGPPSVLEWAEVAMPEPSKGEIRIKAVVSGVGPTDLKIRRGSLGPSIRCQTAPFSDSRPPESSTPSATT